MADSGTILVIDDDPDFVQMHKMVLEQGGYTVLEAEDARTGAELAEQHNPDLILLDVMMEQVDTGFTFAETLGNRFPIIIISSIADSSIKVFDADKLPIRDIVQKPVKADVLLAKVKHALSATKGDR